MVHLVSNMFFLFKNFRNSCFFCDFQLVFICINQATAGLRLLPAEQAETLLSTVKSTLLNSGTSRAGHLTGAVEYVT